MTTYVYITTSYQKKRKLVSEIKEMLAINTSHSDLLEYQETNGSIELLQNIPGGQICVRKYIVLIIPSVLNLEPLDDLSGDLVINCEDLILDLEGTLRKLKTLNNTSLVRTGNAKIRGLDSCLHGISD